MKISFKWLNDYIDVQDYATKPQELAALLTAAGIEVEGIENRAKLFENVVVGHILQKGQHPNADRLTLCQVATGEGVVHQIVCGARNHNEGDRVVVALPGAVLPGDFAIKRSQIRGVDSGGMLCSEKELGLKKEDAEESAGILILPENAPVGQPFAKYMGYDDILLELKVTPNRSDCLSHFGLAREIAALLGREVKFPKLNLEETGGSTRQTVALELRASDLCPRYAGRAVKGVKIAPSPAWLRSRLEAVGLSTINNVVDITNFVMMELGQPLHAFDQREIRGRKIVIARAEKGEKFTTLDGTELKLDSTELTIRDGERAVALAGIVGGQNSGIQDDTTDIFIESAYFTPSAVRRTARKFGVETDSSYRFARGTNPEAVLLARDRAATLIREIAGGEIMGEPYDEYPKPIEREPIEIGLATVESRLGYPVTVQDFTRWMARLGCETIVVSEGEKPTWKVRPPMFRWDLLIDMDLVEEYARLNGYQHIPERIPPFASMPAEHELDFVLEAKTRRLLQGEGCLQAVNYAFIGRAYQESVLGELERVRASGLKAAEEPVAIVNPLNEEINVMRTALTPGLLKNVLHNSRHGNAFGRIYELGYGHFKTSESGGSYVQESRLGFAFWGDAEDMWRKKGPSALVVFALKGVVENWLRGMGIQRFRWIQLNTKNAPGFLHPGQAAVLEFEGKPVGFLGTLHPSLAEEMKIREVAAIAEFNMDALMNGQPRPLKYKSISKMPAVDRDIALQMPKDLPAATVEAEIKKVAGELLREVRVFDVFEGGTLPAGQRSVAFRLVFQAQNSTLEDQKVNELRDQVTRAVTEKFGIVVR